MADADAQRPSEDQEEGPLHGLLSWLRQLRGESERPPSLRAALAQMLEEHDAAQPIDPHERTLLVNILKLHEQTAADVMVPRVDIVALEVETRFADAVKRVVECGHSRLPIYRETLDDILGMVHIKDLLPYAADQRDVTLREITRKLLFVAPTMPLLDLLLQMRLSRIHMAIVVDEFGGADGLVTIEDVIEEIVGEIEDEHDEADQPKLVARPDGTVLAPGRTPLAALEDHFKTPLVPEGMEEGVTTVGGLVVALAGRVPARGEIVQHPKGIDFEVLDADPRRIKRVRLRGVPHAADPG